MVDVVEDEVHFLLVCPKYINTSNGYSNVTDTFVRIMKSKYTNGIKNISAYLYEAFKFHM